MKACVCLANDSDALRTQMWTVIMTGHATCRAKVRKSDAAVKVVKGGGEREQARLLHEIKVLEQCKSTHIVQFFGYA